MKFAFSLLIFVFNITFYKLSAFYLDRTTRPINRIILSNAKYTTLMMKNSDLAVMINGMPGLMALETARSCLDSNLHIVPIGFKGPNCILDDILIDGKTSNHSVQLRKGPGISPEASNLLKQLKSEYSNLIIIDYTHPSAALNNIKCYIENNCDFVMGTTGLEQRDIENQFEKGINYAVIAPNMAKQIVAVQSALLGMVERFPNSFNNYNLKVTESHQSSKADTSGTAKAIVFYLARLNGKKFNTEDIVKLRSRDQQLAFNVPESALDGHAFHTYTLTSEDNSVSFELKHNVCGRRIYADGTVDAVKFIHDIRISKPSKRLYNMIDVLESGKM